MKSFKAVFTVDDPYIGDCTKTYYISSNKIPNDSQIDKIEEIIREGLVVHKVLLKKIKEEKSPSTIEDDFLIKGKSIKCNLDWDGN